AGNVRRRECAGAARKPLGGARQRCARIGPAQVCVREARRGAVAGNGSPGRGRGGRLQRSAGGPQRGRGGRYASDLLALQRGTAAQRVAAVGTAVIARIVAWGARNRLATLLLVGFAT